MELAELLQAVNLNGNGATSNGLQNPVEEELGEEIGVDATAENGDAGGEGGTSFVGGTDGAFRDDVDNLEVGEHADGMGMGNTETEETVV